MSAPAATAGFRGLGAERVAADPCPFFTEDYDQKGVAYFQEHGFEVVHVSHLMPSIDVPHPNTGSVASPAGTHCEPGLIVAFAARGWRRSQSRRLRPVVQNAMQIVPSVLAEHATSWHDCHSLRSTTRLGGGLAPGSTGSPAGRQLDDEDRPARHDCAILLAAADTCYAPVPGAVVVDLGPGVGTGWATEAGWETGTGWGTGAG
jgi:hypothetical protein